MDPNFVFPLNKPFGYESVYYRMRREYEIRYFVSRKRDYILALHPCDKCWFVNFCGHCPDSGSLAYIQSLVALRRANLDIFWSRGTSKIHGILGYAKELVNRAREADIAISLPTITAWSVGDEVGMGFEIQMLDKSLSNGRNGRNYLQFNTVR